MTKTVAKLIFALTVLVVAIGCGSNGGDPSSDKPVGDTKPAAGGETPKPGGHGVGIATPAPPPATK